MKTVLIVDSAQESDISFDFGLDKRLFLRVSVHTAKAARVAINTVQFDMAILGDVPDVENPANFLREIEQVIPEVLAHCRASGKVDQIGSSSIELREEAGSLQPKAATGGPLLCSHN